jgi:hypothetical protein
MSSPPALKPVAPRCACMTRCWWLGQLCYFPLFLSLAFGNVHASLISIGLDSYNDGLVTRDTTTSLDWLDLPLTRNYSINDVISGLNGRSYMDEEWRYATVDEVHQLFGNAGVAIQNEPLKPGQTVYYVGEADTEQLSAISNLQSLLGVNYSSGYDFKTWGWTTPFASRGVSSVALNCCRNYFSNPDKAATIVFTNSDSDSYNSGYDLNSHSTRFGSFLVRQTAPIPEPSTLAIMTLGLTFLGFSRRKQLQ